ncbi:hypothetical protein IT570_06770 [Candidatus Sumerlaeota bacterium]|nr:hypothetical protein [Candidatus Sumerlaeota bacterium]
MRFTNLLLLSFLAFAHCRGFAESITISRGDASYSVNPATLELRAIAPIPAELSVAAGNAYDVSRIVHEADGASWTIGDGDLLIACRVSDSGAFELTATGTDDKILVWPQVRASFDDHLILARDSGLFLPVSDPFWQDILTSDDWDTLERMSMPVWGIMKPNNLCVSWMVSTPFRNRMAFEKGQDATLSIHFTHDFAAMSPERSVTYRVEVDADATPVTPALKYRDWLDEMGGVTTLRAKSKIVPQIERLLGAPHIYLWGDAPFTEFDVLPKEWKSFCSAMKEQSAQNDSLAARIKSQMSTDQWKQVEACLASEWADRYLKRTVAQGISEALASEALSPQFSGTKVELIQHNSKLLHDAFSSCLLPVKDWGNGVSMKMLRRLKAMGFERLRLCLDGWEGIESRPWVAQEAVDCGWLLGTYDSYHSVHDPATASGEDTWPTAQMTPQLWEDGGIMRRDGTFLTGFKGVGRKLNPLFARPFFEKRTSSVLAAIPFNYYFVDCDAYGEVYDDCNPLHTNPLELDAAERTRRLSWLAHEKKVVVGAEGGNVYALEGVVVLEGLFGPYFGWGDEEITSKDSKYFRGRYYPPEQPDIYFKGIPIKEVYRKQYYDPAVRIPLFQAAFHDAVVTTHHWSNDHFKYPDLTRTVELTEMLWMCPPMVHLNYATIEERGAKLKTYLDQWSPLHRQLGFARLTGFKYLTDDHMIQQATWQDGTRIIANFGDNEFTGVDGVIAPRSIGSFPPPAAAP